MEHIESKSCIDQDWNPAPCVASANAAFFRAVVERFELADQAALLAAPARPLEPGPLRDAPENFRVLEAGRIREQLAQWK